MCVYPCYLDILGASLDMESRADLHQSIPANLDEGLQLSESCDIPGFCVGKKTMLMKGPIVEGLCSRFGFN